MEEIPQIVLAQRLFGDPDYLMHVVTRDLSAFKLYDEALRYARRAASSLNACHENGGAGQAFSAVSRRPGVNGLPGSAPGRKGN